MTAIIIGNGSIQDYSFYKKYLENAEYILCADGGAAHARKFGIKPALLLGDFDSIPAEDFQFFKEIGVDIEKFPVEKDMTDTELAAEILIEKGFTDILLIGCLGTRFDHSLGNVFLLKKLLDKGITGRIVNEHNEITLIKDRIELVREEKSKISLLPISERVEGVTTWGMYYPLQNATMEMGSTWGVSNEFSEGTAGVSITKGLLLVIKARD